MNKVNLLLSTLFIFMIFASACNNSNSGTDKTAKDTSTNTVTRDTVLKSDTIKVDPENFSDPH